jgi:hypothetical protein
MFLLLPLSPLWRRTKRCPQQGCMTIRRGWWQCDDDVEGGGRLVCHDAGGLRWHNKGACKGWGCGAVMVVNMRGIRVSNPNHPSLPTPHTFLCRHMSFLGHNPSTLGRGMPSYFVENPYIEIIFLSIFIVLHILFCSPKLLQ